jgi:hypothetical protein
MSVRLPQNNENFHMLNRAQSICSSGCLGAMGGTVLGFHAGLAMSVAACAGAGMFVSMLGSVFHGHLSQSLDLGTGVSAGCMVLTVPVAVITAAFIGGTCGLTYAVATELFKCREPDAQVVA